MSSETIADRRQHLPPILSPDEDSGRLLRLLVHEIRTPLHAIQGFSELLLTGGACPLSAEALGHVREIARAGRALEQVCRLLLELAAPEAAGSVGPVDLGRLLRGLGFELRGEGGAPPVVLGRPAAWWRVGALCRAYLIWPDAVAARPLAAAARPADGGLELELGHDDMRGADGVGLLAIELAQRMAARQGGELRLREPGIVAIRWSRAWVVTGAGEA